MIGEQHGSLQRFPAGPAVVPHRKNAAEWMMWIVVMPVARSWRFLTSGFGLFNARIAPRRFKHFQREG
ncbi:MAG TPA: hypothetical protein VFC46_06145 [Humisphaera sp.]|nr:hypothetical protein [Humisphaera sp.]